MEQRFDPNQLIRLLNNGDNMSWQSNHGTTSNSQPQSNVAIIRAGRSYSPRILATDNNYNAVNQANAQTAINYQNCAINVPNHHVTPGGCDQQHNMNDAQQIHNLQSMKQMHYKKNLYGLDQNVSNVSLQQNSNMQFANETQQSFRTINANDSNATQSHQITDNSTTKTVTANVSNSLQDVASLQRQIIQQQAIIAQQQAMMHPYNFYAHYANSMPATITSQAFHNRQLPSGPITAYESKKGQHKRNAPEYYEAMVKILTKRKDITMIYEENEHECPGLGDPSKCPHHKPKFVDHYWCNSHNKPLKNKGNSWIGRHFESKSHKTIFEAVLVLSYLYIRCS